MKATFNQHIGIFENAVPREWCEKIINLFESNKEYQINRQEAEDNISTLIKSDQHLTTGVDLSPHVGPFINNFWNNIYPLYNSKYGVEEGSSGSTKTITGFKVQKTLPTEGYHIWHYENNLKCPLRVMAYSLYLNNVSQGGETEFLYQSLRVKPNQGTIVLWPAGYTHIHRGNPPLSGEKYIITGWIEYNYPNDNE